jgi:NADH-quinone oxidoreductase subunit L
MNLFLIVFLPLTGALIVGFLGKRLGLLLSHIISCSFIVIPFLLSCYLFYVNFLSNKEISLYLFDWIQSGSLSSSWTLYFDTLTSVMLVVVTSVSALVHIYSIGYMKKDPYQYRFFSYLSFFTFAMLMLVTSNNFLQLFFGWEGVGLASYLLIGFWYEKPSANSAAMKAFVVNRVGDFGLMLGIATLYFATGSVNFEEVFSLSNDLDNTIINLSCLLLFIGAMGKSAQLFLHTWLPDAMEGPTPVSALIHAATMVTAGVFLIARCSPLFEQSEIISSLIIFIGSSTAFFAASVGLVQNDIKRIIAYSTCSQLGYMFVALGVGAYQIAIFHLFTHAFFKALLFLGSGSVIHALSGEQDIRKMGGLAKLIPFTWLFMIIGTLALTGAPFLSGYYSKDGIIEAAYSSHSSGHLYAFYLLVFSVFLTSFYSWRLILLTFHGTTKTPNEVLTKVHESPLTMTVPLFLLSLGAIFSGFLFADLFMSLDFQSLWASSLYLGTNSEIIDSIHHSPSWVKTLPLVMMLAGLSLAMLMYVFFKSLPESLSKRFSFFYNFLLNKWYFDEIYDFLFVKSARKIGNFLSVVFDKGIIDGFGPDGISLRVQQLAKYASRLQTGFIYHYALAMLFGLTAFIFLFVIFG